MTTIHIHTLVQSHSTRLKTIPDHLYSMDISSLTTITEQDANEYITENFTAVTSFTEAGSDIRGEAIDTLLTKKNPELNFDTLAENWDSISESYETKAEFWVAVFTNVFTEELRSQIPESERDTFISVHVSALEDEIQYYSS